MFDDIFLDNNIDVKTILFLHSGNMTNTYRMIQIKLKLLELISNDGLENTEQIDSVLDDGLLFGMIGPNYALSKNNKSINPGPKSLQTIYSWIYNNLSSRDFYSKLYHVSKLEECRHADCFSLALHLCFIDLANILITINRYLKVDIS